MAALADSLASVESTIRRSLNLVPSESSTRPLAATDAVDPSAASSRMLQRTQLIYSELPILTPLKTGGVMLRKLLTLRCVRCSAGGAARGPDEKVRTKRPERKGPAGTSPDHLAYAVGICLNVLRLPQSPSARLPKGF